MMSEKVLSLDNLVRDFGAKGLTLVERIRVRLAYYDATSHFDATHRIGDYKGDVQKYIQERKDYGYVVARRIGNRIIDDWHRKGQLPETD